MKRILVIILALCSILLSACSGSSNKWMPDVASEETIKYGEKALEVIEQYLNLDLDADEVDNEIEELHRRLRHIDLEEDSDKYNKADIVIIETIESYADFGVKYKSDTELKQVADILRVQIGKKTSGKKYDPTEFRYGEDGETLKQFLNMESSTAIYSSVDVGDEIYMISLSYDAMYGTTTKEVTSSIMTILDNAKKQNLSVSHLWVTFHYYKQDVFTISIYDFVSSIRGEIYLSDTDDVFAEFNNSAELELALDKIVDYVAIK